MGVLDSFERESQSFGRFDASGLRQSIQEFQSLKKEELEASAKYPAISGKISAVPGIVASADFGMACRL